MSVDDVMEALQARGHTCVVVVNCPFNGAEHHMNAQLHLVRSCLCSGPFPAAAVCVLVRFLLQLFVFFVSLEASDWLMLSDS